MPTLTISHYIYLTREQRYKLHNGEPIEVVGVSIPVWFSRGNTSEPAQELFCKYRLTNEPINRVIVSFDEGYQINLPQKPLDMKFEIDTSLNLLDMKDGGSEWLEFRQLNKVNKDDSKFNLIHFVEIKPEEILLNTLT